MTPLDAPKSPKVDQQAETQPGGAFTESYDSMAEASQTLEFNKDDLDQINKMFGSADELLDNNSMASEIEEQDNQENSEFGEQDEEMEGLMTQPDDEAIDQDESKESVDQDSTENFEPERDDDDSTDDSRQIPQEDSDSAMSDQELLDGLQGDNGAPMQPGSEDQYNSNVDRWSEPEDTPPANPYHSEPRSSEEDTYPRMPLEPNNLIIPPYEYEA